ncbi:MAG: ABC transporter permease [Rhodospirillales bacterium]|nr:ABC transporter permease [Rhodospirillales bacterium]
MRRTAPGEDKAGWQLSRRYNWLLIAPAFFLLVFFLWPLMRVVVRSFVDPAPGLANYQAILASPVYLRVLYNTVETAAVVTLLCLLIGYPIAYVMARAQGVKLRIVAALVVIPLWTSVVIRSYAWMVVFQRRGVLNEGIGTVMALFGESHTPIQFLPGALAVHVGMVHIMLPFMILPLVASMRNIDRRLMRAAGVLGADPIQSFLRVFLPLSLPGVSAGSALVFMMSLGFYVTPALLGGPRHMMSAVLIEQQANQLLNWGLASALATLLLLVTLAIYAVHARISGVGLAGAGGRA